LLARLFESISSTSKLFLPKNFLDNPYIFALSRVRHSVVLPPQASQQGSWLRQEQTSLAIAIATLHQGQSPAPSRHCLIALKAVASILYSLELFLVSFSPVQRLSLFIEEVLLEEIEPKIVIFVDEIDRVLSQSFSLDDFFALIRFFYNRRVDEPKYQRITFGLLGVATPSDLITDKTQTPFNIGRAIALSGFQLQEVQPLTDGLMGKVNNPQEAIAQILDWTGGQPFLTQKLCKLMVEESASGNSPSVEQVGYILKWLHSRFCQNVNV
jgi:hypothetical protein